MGKSALDKMKKAGTETVRKDSASEKGAVGSHGENYPAQKKVPEKSPASKEKK